ncbi:MULTISPECIES: segregation and condensation protein A [Nitrospirillum]|uniref:Segregation and condensation protein A n=1 Tax=Nitrospirillum amazonense TaxID=28077 RepID=A0A560EXI3_9PROT|nr:ScpA family protein [Nitrospirillum amazonense]MEC4593403.1 ScpA family protein [Nitrospirillum amazonense]TWB14110.1 condensin subunit ScpA [Nitrospirillum amazonense]
MADARGPDEDWSAAPALEPVGEGEPALLVDLGEFEGPIDLLLTLARDQKVDLTRISILALAEQYLAFVEEARRLRLEVAADYLVTAAWLAYLKSRLLLPTPETEEPTGEELAQALAFQLQRLEAMQNAAARLMARPRLGRDIFPRGAPEDLPVFERRVTEVTLYDLLRAYGDIKRRQQKTGPLHLPPVDLFTIEDAIRRVEAMLGRLPDWTRLDRFLPPDWRGGGTSREDKLKARSALAATFVATLELAKAGQLEVRQDGTFGPLYVRRTDTPAAPPIPDKEP